MKALFAAVFLILIGHSSGLKVKSWDIQRLLPELLRHKFSSFCYTTKEFMALANRPISEDVMIYTDPSNQEARERAIGSGAFGKLFRVKYNGVTRAMKVILRFQHDADQDWQIANELHYWIKIQQSFYYAVPILHDCIYDNEQFFLVADLMDTDLFKFAEHTREQPSNIRLALDLMKKATMLILDLYRANIYHHDIKSENFLLSKGTDDFYRIVVTDFGFTTEGTKVEGFKGTQLFMPPEKLRGSPVDANSAEPFSLAMFFWDLLANEIGYSGPCLKFSVTAQCHTDMQSRLKKFFEQRFGWETKTEVSSVEEVAHINDLIYWALRENPLERPTFYKMMDALNNLIEAASTSVII